MTPLSPEEVLKQIAEALPEECREHVIIIGSLAAGYHYFSGNPERSIRTKDVDCMFSPHAKAVSAAGTVTEQLLKANWAPKAGGEWSTPGTDETPEDKLPMIRLQPPGVRGSADWFLELLGAPDTQAQEAKTFRRVQTTMGHFAICSFNFLALAEWQPILTALHAAAKLLHPLHPLFQICFHIDRRGGDRLVTQHTLHEGKISIGLLEQMVCEGVAQPVG